MKRWDRTCTCNNCVNLTWISCTWRQNVCTDVCYKLTRHCVYFPANPEGQVFLTLAAWHLALSIWWPIVTHKTKCHEDAALEGLERMSGCTPHSDTSSFVFVFCVFFFLIIVKLPEVLSVGSGCWEPCPLVSELLLWKCWVCGVRSHKTSICLYTAHWAGAVERLQGTAILPHCGGGLGTHRSLIRIHHISRSVKGSFFFTL